MVAEVFHSIQGESSRVGLPCTLVRLAGCNLRCRWCDTQYAWTDGEAMTIEQVLAKVATFGCRRVEVTGGEPLIQPATPGLLRQLLAAGCETLLETNGSLDIGLADDRVARIVDFKCPSSGQSHANLWANVEKLTPRDEVKLVLADRADYDFAVASVRDHDILRRCGVIFSPIHGVLPPATLAEWILADGLDVRLGIQLHKILWPDRQRGV